MRQSIWVRINSKLHEPMAPRGIDTMIVIRVNPQKRLCGVSHDTPHTTGSTIHTLINVYVDLLVFTRIAGTS